MLRYLVILELVILFNTHNLEAQTAERRIEVENQVDQFLQESLIEPDSLILVGKWLFSGGFYSSYIYLKDNGRFKSGESTCFGRYGGRGKWYISNDQLELRSLSKFRKLLVYAFKDCYFLIDNDGVTVDEIKLLASDIYRKKPMSKEDLWGLVMSMVLIKQQEKLDTQTQ